MTRLPRYASPGMSQHVIQRGTNRSTTFARDADYHFYRECLEAACAQHRCQVHAYVFMTNHVHLLMTPATADGIPSVMQSVGRRYVRRFNSTYNRTGTLWEGRYRATVVDHESYVLACHRYIEMNPVRAGLAADPRGYRWSSHEANAYGAGDSILTAHECYGALGSDAKGRQAAYRALFITELDATVLDSIRDATNQGWALGGKRFREEIAALLNRRAEPALPGRRPRRKDDIRL